MTELIKCACGCGATLEPFDARGRPRIYLPSHYSKIQPTTRIAVTCENCGATILRAPNHVAKVEHNFCDHKCAGEWASKTGIRRGANNGHYNTITVKCAGRCGAKITKAKSLIRRRNNRVYCKDCTHLIRRGRRGFYASYPKEFNGYLRKKIRDRDNHTCQECGIKESESGTLHVHHIDYNKQNSDEHNLISLCNVCHSATNFNSPKWTKHYQSKIEMIYSYPASPAGYQNVF